MKRPLAHFRLFAVSAIALSGIGLITAAGAESAPAAPPNATKSAGQAPSATKRARAADLAGTYRCRSYNVGGAGGRPPVGTPPLVLNADGTYAMSREHGTFTVTGEKVILSESKVRGPGKLMSDGQIVFAYDLNGLHHVVTYWRQ